jgi:hypothetical protein
VDASDVIPVALSGASLAIGATWSQGGSGSRYFSVAAGAAGSAALAGAVVVGGGASSSSSSGTTVDVTAPVAGTPACPIGTLRGTLRGTAYLPADLSTAGALVRVRTSSATASGFIADPPRALVAGTPQTVTLRPGVNAFTLSVAAGAGGSVKIEAPGLIKAAAGSEIYSQGPLAAHLHASLERSKMYEPMQDNRASVSIGESCEASSVEGAFAVYASNAGRAQAAELVLNLEAKEAGSATVTLSTGAAACGTPAADTSLCVAGDAKPSNVPRGCASFQNTKDLLPLKFYGDCNAGTASLYCATGFSSCNNAGAVAGLCRAPCGELNTMCADKLGAWECGALATKGCVSFDAKKAPVAAPSSGSGSSDSSSGARAHSIAGGVVLVVAVLMMALIQ